MRTSAAGAVVLLVALTGCSAKDDVPECVGSVVEGAERTVDSVPYPLSGGGRVAASAIDMADDPPSAWLHVLSEDPDEGGAVQVTVGSTFDMQEVTYEVVRICVGNVDVLAVP